MNALQPIQAAIDADAYDWLAQHAPGYVTAIEKALQAGSNPTQIRRFMQAQVGPDRAGLALRCEQAARYMEGQTA